MKHRRLVEILLLIWCIICIAVVGNSVASLFCRLVPVNPYPARVFFILAAMVITGFFVGYYEKAECREKQRADHYQYLYMKEKADYENYEKYIEEMYKHGKLK